MKSIERVFSEYSVELYAAIPYSALREINPRIRERAGFTPRTAIVYLLPYYAGECRNISRYAASRDYHIAIREIGDGVISALRESYPESTSRSFGDHSPIDEVSAALAAGLGVRGDNGLIINEKYGSYVFVGDVLTDISPELLGAVEPREISRCPGCGACRRACPTGILRGEGEDCLSAITQRKGELSDSEKALMRKYNTAWGCDICQQVCPYNRNPKITPIEFFRKSRIEELTAESLSTLDDAALSERAFGWRGRGVLTRNIAALAEGDREKR